MRHSWILLIPLLVAGCATPAPVAMLPSPPAVVAAVSPTKFVETRYDLRSYREATSPAVRHEAHAVYRRTRVPATASDELATVSLTTYAPASVAPLPVSDELAAEIATQKKITADLRVMQNSVAETEQRMQAQYAVLVRQSAEALKLHGQLEAERARLQNTIPANSSAPAPTGATVANSTEAKW